MGAACFLKTLLALCFTLTVIRGVYVDKGYPFIGGPLRTNLLFVTERHDKSPLHSTVFYPQEAGQYGVYYFIPGANGYVESELYSNYLSNVASHGFIVIGTDLIFPAETPPKSPVKMSESDLKTTQSDKFISQYRWLEENLEGLVNKRHSGIEILWNYTALGSHSSGGDVARLILDTNHTIAKASVFVEPVGITFEKPINFSVPSLMYGAELSEEHKHGSPPCVIPGFGYQHFYNLWTPTKVLLEVKGYGHCDILDIPAWEVCKKFGICVMGNNTNLDIYRNYIQGVTSAFLVSTMLGYNNSIGYVIDQTKVPVTYLQDKSEFA